MYDFTAVQVSNCSRSGRTCLCAIFRLEDRAISASSQCSGKTHVMREMFPVDVRPLLLVIQHSLVDDLSPRTDHEADGGLPSAITHKRHSHTTEKLDHIVEKCQIHDPHTPCNLIHEISVSSLYIVSQSLYPNQPFLQITADGMPRGFGAYGTHRQTHRFRPLAS